MAGLPRYLHRHVFLRRNCHRALQGGIRRRRAGSEQPHLYAVDSGPGRVGRSAAGQAQIPNDDRHGSAHPEAGVRRRLGNLSYPERAHNRDGKKRHNRSACQEWLKTMPSCHYRILSHARYTHAMGKLHACGDTVATHVWQSTHMHWACGTHAMRNVHACSDAVVTYV
jgi:hypothetical protein